jgi:hypothetical protein
MPFSDETAISLDEMPSSSKMTIVIFPEKSILFFPQKHEFLAGASLH